MAEFIAILQEIQQYPPGLHLFCPRQNHDDLDRYEDERNPTSEEPGSNDTDRLARIEETKIRRNKFISSLQLLAYDGKESEQYQRFIFETLDDSLGRCDICIREYYIAKVAFLEALREDYEEEDINNFFALIHRRDVERVIRGLSAADQILQATPEQKRGTAVLEPKHLHALFEALICEAFLKDEANLQNYFDSPFQLIQSKKPLKMREILPAAVRFLFDSNRSRMGWATLFWERIGRCPTEIEWDWAMKQYLQTKLQLATEPNDISKLWSALSIIVPRLDERMITYKLFDLHPNLCTTALNHLAKRTSAVPQIIATLQTILERAPEAFWQAMGSISSQTIVEQIFSSPSFNTHLQDPPVTPDTKEQPMLTWMVALLDSLKPANRPLATQTLVNQLFERVENTSLSLPARKVCFEMAVKVALKTIITFSDEEHNQHSVERLVYVDTLNMISHRLDEILKPRDPALAKALQPEVRADIMNLVKNSIALECKCLRLDFESLSFKGSLRHESSMYSPEIWTTVINNLRDDDPQLSTAALVGIMPLPGLEQFRIREGDPLTREKKSYNSIFEKLTGMVARLLERISEFQPAHLDHLFRAQDTSMSLIAALFSPHQETYQAAIDLIKNISGESGRKEALAHLINAFLATTIYGVCWTFRRVANFKTFASVPRMLKTGMDILDVLCNPTNGQLRRSDLSSRDAKAIQSHWSYQWIALKVIYAQMERWSNELHDRQAMAEVCRDAMQYAEALFDQYDLFASVLSKAKPEKADEISQTLLDSTGTSLGSPLNALDTMCKWLRLRDEYLADTLVSLISSMLYRLQSHNAIVKETEGLKYVEEVATKQAIRTILSASQKARLVRALESYLRRQIEKPVVKKQATLNLKEWKDLATTAHSGASTPDSLDRSVDEYGDDGIADEDLLEIASKTLGTQRSAVTNKDKNDILSLLSQAQPVKPSAARATALELQAKKAREAKAFIENRKREEAARKLRDKEAALRLRGQTGVGAQTKGQGSGLAGIGVLGKDHSAGPNSLMVSSESESEPDSDEELFGARPKERLTVRDQIGLKKSLPAGPVRKIKQVRSQKDVRARLAPDLSDLHRTILGWDFFAETDTPPNSTREDYTLVTDTFRTAADYQKTFEPLLVLEGWQSFRSAREDNSFKPFEVKVANSLIVDSFFEINSQMAIADGKDLGLGVSDVVLLSRSKAPAQDPNEPHCLARVKEISRKRGELQIVYRVNAAQNPLRPFLNDKAIVYGVSILSLTPLEREYGALMALQYYDLCEEIIRAKPSPILEYSEAELRPIEQTYDVNLAQAKAVKSALDNDAFTLIQGPPGSGKTKTICALVGAMLTGFIRKEVSVGPRLNAVSARPPPGRSAAKKVLVCAPSNAAVDELVMRFKNGLTLLDGTSEKASVVRLGRSEAINANVKDVTLEELVNTRLSGSASRGPGEDTHAMMMEHKALSDELRQLLTSINERRAKDETVPSSDDQLVDMLKRKKNALGARIDDLREKQNTASRDAELNRKRIQQEILDSAHILCATLSGSGHELFQGLNVEFETVVIDEAAQSIELSALIPLKYGCSKCILVGDPKQLPPTVLSRTAAKFQYEQSLFARMENNHKKDVHLLDTQYRMHPDISLFPSKMFYDSRLKDGDGMASLRRRPWHQSEVLAPYRFFDVHGMSESESKGHSLVNHAEINVAMQLYNRVVTDVRGYDFSGKIGIITPYKGQLRLLRARFQAKYGEAISSKVEFNTTDAFQGRESEIIIFSCVRASTKGLGFLNDIRRMNVGLTRAKSSLWVLGNAQALAQGEFWRALVDDAVSRKAYTKGDITQLLGRPLLTITNDVDMLDVSEPSSETVRSSTAREVASTNGSGSTDSLETHKRVVDVPRSGNLSKQDTPVPSRPSSALSRQSSASSSSKPDTKRPEVIRQNSGQQVTKREPARSDTKPVHRLPPKQPETEPRSKVDAGLSSTSGYNPSGGGNGLNDHMHCAVCGSHEHYSTECDNEEALAGSLGTCSRCREPGHSYSRCQAPRCLNCGEVGHQDAVCDTPLEKRLNKTQQDKVRREETRFTQIKEQSRQKRVEKKLDEHAPTIPVVKSSLPPLRSNGDVSKSDAKRKRDESTSSSDRGKIPRVDPQIRGTGSDNTTANTNNPHAPRSGSGRPPPPSVAAGLPKPPLRPGSTPNNAPPLVRKKKANADDMFMKRR